MQRIRPWVRLGLRISVPVFLHFFISSFLHHLSIIKLCFSIPSIHHAEPEESLESYEKD